MQDVICPFGATLARDTFGCTHATSVIRRGGTEFSCRNPDAHARCLRLFEQLKAAGLSAFAVEDDPTRMPHSVLVRIQFGGLLGLQRTITGQPGADGRIEDIDALVDAAITHFGGLPGIPCEQLTPDMTAYSLTRRRRR